MKPLRLFSLVLCVILLTGCSSSSPSTSASETALSGTETQTPEHTDSPPETDSQEDPPQIVIPPVPVFDPQLILDTMTDAEKVGQLLLVQCPDSGAVNYIEEYQPAGFILFNRDFQKQTPDGITAAIQSYQQAAKIPLLIAVDEEGGTVTRVSTYSAFRGSKFASPRDLYNRGGMELVLKTEEEKAMLLHSLGINVNVAPVCDITTKTNAFMYKRSLGQSPEITGQFAIGALDAMSKHSVSGVLKHFPGYGNNSDTHVGIATDKRSLRQLLSSDLVPFQAAIQSGCDAIMVSHTFINCLDKDYPATLSPAVHQYMRVEMGFDGVIVTDDLAMGAITAQYSAGEAAVLAVLAGNDLLCTTNYTAQYNAILSAVESGRISEQVLNAAVCRVLQWKYDMGLLPENSLSTEIT